MHTYVCYDICYVFTCVHCLQVIGVTSAQSCSALHQNTTAYDVPSVTTNKDQRVNIFILLATITDLMYMCI